MADFRNNREGECLLLFLARNTLILSANEQRLFQIFYVDVVLRFVVLHVRYLTSFCFERIGWVLVPSNVIDSVCFIVVSKIFQMIRKFALKLNISNTIGLKESDLITVLIQLHQ